jgi:hypothetical protein
MAGRAWYCLKMIEKKLLDGFRAKETVMFTNAVVIVVSANHRIGFFLSCLSLRILMFRGQYHRLCDNKTKE